MSTSLQSLHELDTFAAQFLGPSAESQSEMLGDTSEQFEAMADIEAVMWLQVSVELGVLPPKEADELLDRHAARIFNSFHYVNLVGLSHLFAEFSLFESGLAGTALSVASFVHPNQLSPNLFDKDMLLMVLHEVGRTFRSGALTTDISLSSWDWDRCLDRSPDPDVILDSKNLEGINRLIDSYLAFLDHAGNLREFWEHLDPDDSGGYGIFELQRRIRAMHNWRLNLFDDNVKERFESLTANFIRGLAQDTELQELRFDVAALRDRVEALCRSWSGDETLTLNVPFDERGGIRRVA
jgi:hypothetical protein